MRLMVMQIGYTYLALPLAEAVALVGMLDKAKTVEHKYVAGDSHYVIDPKGNIVMRCEMAEVREPTPDEPFIPPSAPAEPQPLQIGHTAKIAGPDDSLF